MVFLRGTTIFKGQISALPPPKKMRLFCNLCNGFRVTSGLKRKAVPPRCRPASRRLLEKKGPSRCVVLKWRSVF